jgi:hypothetical protein
MTETTWPAPAKINLFLHVLGREPDGYHRLQTLFQLLDWGDSVRIEVTSDRQVSMLKPTPGVPAVEDLCVRAAEILQAKTGARAGARIAVTKRIPLGAGLGGGSSDAATVLFALNALWRTGLTVSELAEIGLRIGADVPVFIHGHTAWAEGRGERLRVGFPGHRGVHRRGVQCAGTQARHAADRTRRLQMGTVHERLPADRVATPAATTGMGRGAVGMGQTTNERNRQLLLHSSRDCTCRGQNHTGPEIPI